MSETSKAFKSFKLVIDKSEANKLFEFIKFINKVSISIFLFKTQHKEYLKKRAIGFDKNSDVFITITEKDKLNFIIF